MDGYFLNQLESKPLVLGVLSSTLEFIHAGTIASRMLRLEDVQWVEAWSPRSTVKSSKYIINGKNSWHAVRTKQSWWGFSSRLWERNHVNAFRKSRCLVLMKGNAKCLRMRTSKWLFVLCQNLIRIMKKWILAFYLPPHGGRGILLSPGSSVRLSVRPSGWLGVNIYSCECDNS